MTPETVKDLLTVFGEGAPEELTKADLATHLAKVLRDADRKAASHMLHFCRDACDADLTATSIRLTLPHVDCTASPQCTIHITEDMRAIVNSSLATTRSVLLRASPGVGKTSLVYFKMAAELQVGSIVLYQLLDLCGVMLPSRSGKLGLCASVSDGSVWQELMTAFHSYAYSVALAGASSLPTDAGLECTAQRSADPPSPPPPPSLCHFCTGS
jgi:hypothetical protein